MSSSHSPQPGFTPRPEFLKGPTPTRHTFALLTLAGSNYLRLYSFNPPHLISSLTRFLNQNELMTGFREDLNNNFCEFALDGKPWSTPKSIATERLLIEVLVLLYQQGYCYVSTIDYGREHDDRLAIAFSRQSSASADSTLNVEKTSRVVPFALSFPSASILRVILPPLHSTPAILQAVRGSWPRGVVSEKKVGYNIFEFKLKGYKWFEEDTFATDSLKHILSLLSSLDLHSFSLVTSLSLTNRSRVKDLWIFTGPASSLDDVSLPESPVPSVLSSSLPELKRHAQTPDQSFSHHRRLETEPAASSSASPPPQHARSASDPHRVSLLRKPAPRAQLPLSVHDDEHDNNAPSKAVVSPGEAITPDVFYSSSPFGPAQTTHTQPLTQHSYTPSPISNISPTPGATSPIPPSGSSSAALATPDTPNELLGAAVFRDSAVSSCSNDPSLPVPIQWTGVMQNTEMRPPFEEHESAMPIVPGGWQPTPVEEPHEHPVNSKELKNQVQEVVHRFAEPKVNEAVRKSETGIVEIMPSEVPETGKDGEGKGWVLVNVDGPAATGDGPVNLELKESPQSMSPVESHPNASMSPAAKAIVIIDAVEAKKSKTVGEIQSSTRIKRLLSLGRKDSKSEQTKVSLGLQGRLKQLRTPQASRKDGKRRSIDG